MSEVKVEKSLKSDPFITIKVSEQIAKCTDTELLEYQENLKSSNKSHNLQLSKFKVLTGAEFGEGLKKQFIESKIFTEDQFTSYSVNRFDVKTGAPVKDKLIVALKQFHTIKTNLDSSELLYTFADQKIVKPLIQLDQELKELESSMQVQGSLKGYKVVHSRYNEIMILQDKALQELKNNKTLMSDLKESEKVENTLNAIAYRRTTHKHRFSVLLNTLKLVSIEGEIDHRAEINNELLTTRKTDMQATFQKLLGSVE